MTRFVRFDSTFYYKSELANYRGETIPDFKPVTCGNCVHYVGCELPIENSTPNMAVKCEKFKGG